MSLWTEQSPLEAFSLERKSPGEDAWAYCVAESIATWHHLGRGGAVQGHDQESSRLQDLFNLVLTP